MEITKIQQQKKNQNRFNVFVDDRYEFSITDRELVSTNLHKGKVSSEDLKLLKFSASKGILFDQAIFYDATRPHSVYEHTKHLKTIAFRYKLNEDISQVIDAVISDLLLNGYINDKNFTEWFIKQRINSKRPKGEKVIAAELIKKGIKKNMIDEKLEGLLTDEMTAKNAYKMALNKLNSLKGRNEDIDKVTLRTKISRFLIGKGYSYNTINDTFNKLEI